MKKWDLSKLYVSFDSSEFQSDMNLVDELIIISNDFKSKLLKANNESQVMEEFLKVQIQTVDVITRLYNYIALRQSTDTINQDCAKYEVLLQKKLSEFTEISTLFSKYVSSISDLKEKLTTPFLKEHQFFIAEIVLMNKYNLDEKTEGLLSKLSQSSSSLWSRLQGVLTSTLEVEYKGEILTLPEILSKSEDVDAEVRKTAYEAELRAYPKIDKAVAFALNGIKGEVNTLTKKRGYQSALEKALIDSRMKEDTLKAMLSAMQDYLPEFRKYLKRKGKVLGHKNGLPWYDLYAPMGQSSKVFSIEEAQEYILSNFKTFSPHLEDLAQRAFDGNWVDYLPHKGKVGGAFCANISPIKESRILTNFAGSFGDVVTLSHELGHAYHGDNIFSESILNSEYTMPVAETASTFCETIVFKAALNDAEEKEKIALLESNLQGSTAVVVDILSRYLFETSVFDQQKSDFLDENQLKELMLTAQKEAYGDGLDHDYLHPYMWLWKSHYYSAGLSFYNWPYAFGLLFAKGLYGQFQKDKTGFPPKYDLLLKATGKMSVEDVAMLADIDVTKKAFWVTSLEVIKEEIDLFLSLTEE